LALTVEVILVARNFRPLPIGGIGAHLAANILFKFEGGGINFTFAEEAVADSPGHMPLPVPHFVIIGHPVVVLDVLLVNLGHGHIMGVPWAAEPLQGIRLSNELVPLGLWRVGNPSLIHIAA
jgi:hypothetical protein